MFLLRPLFFSTFFFSYLFVFYVHFIAITLQGDSYSRACLTAHHHVLLPFTFGSHLVFSFPSLTYSSISKITRSQFTGLFAFFLTIYIYTYDLFIYI